MRTRGCRARRGAAAIALSCAAAACAAQDVIEAGRFSAFRPGDALPPQWVPLTFRNIEARTRYSLAADAGVTVLKAESSRSASGLIRRFDEQDPYMRTLRQKWGEGVRRAFAELPRLEWDGH